MYVASYLKQKGYCPEILNVDIERITNSDVVKRVKEIDPKYIGFSGMVATSYKYIKELSRELRREIPEKIQILGGGLSSAAETILNNTAIDIVVWGEGEVTACDLIDTLDKKGDLKGLPGIYYKEGQMCVQTPNRPLIRNLDALPYPAFDLIDINHYLPEGLELLRYYTKKVHNRMAYKKNRKKRMINILTNRGCIGSCGFCSRPDPGLRMPSIKYVFDLIEYCIEKFDVGFFSFGDECFMPNKERNWKFIEEYKRRKLDIIFRIGGLRVDAVDKDVLKAYSEIGCWMINYGFESGSQKMLNIIDKRVAVEQNRKAALWTYEAGIYATVQLILGMPGETNETIRETMDFVKSLNLDFKQYKLTNALPMPGSQLYNYAKLTQAIEDDDGYLSSLGEIEGTTAFHVNLTDEEDSVAGGWLERITRELDDHYFYKKYKTRNGLVKRLAYFLESIGLHYRRKDLLAAAGKKVSSLFYSILDRNKKKAVIQKKYAPFKKKKKISIEEFLKDGDCSSVSRDISLKKINQKLCAIQGGMDERG